MSFVRHMALSHHILSINTKETAMISNFILIWQYFYQCSFLFWSKFFLLFEQTSIMVITVTFLVHSLTLPAMRYRILWLPEIKEGVNFDPMLLYSIYYLVFLGVTCKKSARNLKILARFQDFKIVWNGNSAPPWQMKNRRNSLDFEDTGFKFYMKA